MAQLKFVTDVEVRSNGDQAGVFAPHALDGGVRVMGVEGDVRTEPHRYSVQIGPDVHVFPTNAAWKFLNHSCQPNLAYDAATLGFVTLRPIAAHEELSFNYLTTEWDMAEGFDCACGAPRCRGFVAGFKHLSYADKMVLLPQAAPHIQELHARTARRVSIR